MPHAYGPQLCTWSLAAMTIADAFSSAASRSHVVPTASGGAFQVSTYRWHAYNSFAASSSGSNLQQRIRRLRGVLLIPRVEVQQVMTG